MKDVKRVFFMPQFSLFSAFNEKSGGKSEREGENYCEEISIFEAGLAMMVVVRKKKSLDALFLGVVI
jgi:hypothetical protein